MCFSQTPNLTLWVSSGQPLRLISALSDDGSASGDLFWDDGESIDTYETDQYSYIVFNVAQVHSVNYLFYASCNTERFKSLFCVS